MNVDAAQAFYQHLPETVLSGLALLILFLGTLRRPGLAEYLPRLAVASVLVAALLLRFNDGGFVLYARFAVLLVGLVIILAYWSDTDSESPGEFLASILFSLA